MKKCKLYFQISIIVGLIIICILFSCGTIYYLYKNDSGNAGVFATLIGILLTLILTFWTYLFDKSHKSTLIEQYLNDEHFVDREMEYIKLLNLIQNEPDRIIYINGRFGMGKTLFMKMSCDRINFTDKKKWKSYAAFYYNNNRTKTIIQALSNKFCGHSNASVTDISQQLNNATLKKNCILFIDNIYEIDLLECTEVAKAFINCKKSNQVIIAVDSNDDDFHICPSKFGENEIKLLAISYNTEIEKEDRKKISILSNGYPVYARYSVEAYTKGIKITDYRNLENYIEKLIYSLNDLEKRSLSLIICLSQFLQDGIKEKAIYGIDNRITQPIIKRLSTYSLINVQRNKIYADKLISLKCLDFLSNYKNESYKKIYQYYKRFSSVSYIALFAALKSDFKYDYALIKKILHDQYVNNNFYLLIDLGELEVNGQINSNLYEDKECWIYIRYYYLKALLELGLYNKAREVVDNCDNQFNLLNINSNITFEYQYLLADLDHLTNYFQNAISFSQALLKKSSTIDQKIKCQYLYAHCLRHIGEDLNLAFTVFSDLAKSTSYKNDKIRIRSIYSAASIKMFQKNKNYNYKNSFETINEIICNDDKNEIWKPYVIRHKAIYEYKICKDPYMAEKTLREAINLLEVTSLRIKYDIYFELAEVYRIYDNKLNNYEKSLAFYSEAEQFAKRVHDYNLQSNSQLGIMLLNLKYGYEINIEMLRTIIIETRNLNLNINYNYAIYIKYIIANEAIPKELSLYWKKMQYSDLLFYSSKSKSEKYNLKLTVM